ncbi:MAG: glycosyltransferase family 9 protein [Flavobacteriaceae bacterium]|nr:glycosyltransferase family 9 protein [Flavobacteriaceae bacterium]
MDKPTRSDGNAGTPNIVVLRLSAMGDVAMLVPVLRVFKQKYPQYKITMVSKPAFKALFDEFENLDFIAAEVKGKHKGIRGLVRLTKKILATRPTALADMHDVLRSKFVRQYITAKGIAVKYIDKGREEKKALIRAENKCFQPLMHTTERYAQVFDRLGLKLNFEASKAEGIPQKKEKPKEEVYKIGIAPFAAHPAKAYPKESMLQVIDAIAKLDHTEIYLFGGGKTESEILETWANNRSNVHNMAGKLDFSEELKQIANLAVMLSMDSGNTHLAAIYGVPTITLWGVTHPYAGFAPYGQPLENALLPDLKKYPLIPTSVYGNKYPKGYENAIGDISPERIVAKVKSILLLW